MLRLRTTGPSRTFAYRKTSRHGMLRCAATANPEAPITSSEIARTLATESSGRGPARSYTGSSRGGPARSSYTSRDGRPAAQRAPAPYRSSQPGSETAKERLPELYFLEDDPEVADRRAATAYEKYISKGKSLIVRSLGKAGAAGAMKMVVKLRALAEAATPQRDVRLRLVPMEPVLGFGRPVMMFVETAEGRMTPPADDSVISRTVSSATEFSRLQSNIRGALLDLKPGQHLMLEMVGSFNMQRALLALADARAAMVTGGSLVVVPTLLQQPPRQRVAAAAAEGAKAEANSGSEASAGDVAVAAAPAAPAPEAAAEAGTSEGAGSEPEGLVDVLRLYVSRVIPRTSTSVAGGVRGAGASSSTRQPVASPAEPAVGEGQIVVSAAEWETLRGALGSMVEQQKALTQLLEQQQKQAAATAAAEAGGPVPAPPAVAPAQPTTGSA